MGELPDQIQFSDVIDEVSDDFDALMTTVSGLDVPLIISRFTDMGARTKIELNLSLRQFADVLTKCHAPTKEGLPWFKLAQFGELRTENDCLRSNDNLLTISGVEGDYDGEKITLGHAESMLRDANIAALLYTSAKHMIDGHGPRWRVFVPISHQTPPEQRDRLMARLNGVFAGALDAASFTLSQSYYGGNIDGNPAMIVRLIDGRAIDLVDDLDADAIDRDGHHPGDGEEVAPADQDEPSPLGLTVDEIREFLDRIPDERWVGYDGAWFNILAATHHETGGSEEGYQAALEVSQRKPGWDSGCFPRRKWKSLGSRRRGRRLTFRHILDWLGEPWTITRADEFEDLDDDFDQLLSPPSPAPALDDDWDGGADEPPPGWVARLNSRHSVAFVQGKTVILTQNPDGSVSYGSATDLHTFYENDRRPTKTSSEPITKCWMRHAQRASYPHGVVFAPNGAPNGAYNHWRGFAVEPDPSASCVLFLAHLRDVICGRDDEAYQWLIRWLAHMVQRPQEKPGTAVVLRGRKGTGKDSVAEYVGGLFPHHHTKIGNAEHLYGRFNAHQEKTLLLHVEEGFWAGDKKAEGQLKHVITSEQVQIEPKGVNAFQVRSVLRVFISSNEAWVVPASFDERRFFVQNVPGSKRDAAYFTALYEEMKDGGRAALLHHLQTLDLAGFDVRNPPMTAGLREQKLASLRGVELWWHEALHRGALPTGFGDTADWSSGTQTVGRDALRSEYVTWSKSRRFDGEIANDIHFGRRLREMLPELGDARPRVAGSRVRQYVVPSLDACREAFDAWIGAAGDWEMAG